MHSAQSSHPGKNSELPADDLSFFSRLDAKLEKRNGKLRAKLIAWGELLDAAGWCVVLDLAGAEGIWISDRARKNCVMPEHAPRGLRKLSEGIWIWPGERSPETTPTSPLTRREAEVLSWLKAGKTSYEISVILGCAPRTLEKHLTNLYRKLGVSGRTSVLLTKPSL